VIPRLLLVIAVLLPGLAACRRPPAEAPASAAPPAANAPANRIDIPANVRGNLGITFARVEARRVAQTLRVPGAFELEPRARREYRMALPGHVEIAVDQHERVEQGALLFRFRTPAWPELLHEVIESEQALAASRAGIAVARARLEEARSRVGVARGRVEALERAGARDAALEAQAAELGASLPRLEAELLLAETELANAHRARQHALHRASAATGLAEERLEEPVRAGEGSVPTFMTIDWIEVRALASGIVEALAVTDGAYVEVPALVLSTVDPARVRFRGQALQADLPRLAGISRARIVPPRSPGISVHAAVEAEVALGLEADPAQRTLALFAAPASLAAWIRPGVSAFLEIELASSDGPALAIPRSAVVQDGLTHVFFRRDPSDPDRVLRVEADLGPSDGRWVEVRSGVRPGDEVVLDGTYELLLAVQARGAPGPGGHVHADGSVHEDH